MASSPGGRGSEGPGRRVASATPAMRSPWPKPRTSGLREPAIALPMARLSPLTSLDLPKGAAAEGKWGGLPPALQEDRDPPAGRAPSPEMSGPVASVFEAPPMRPAAAGATAKPAATAASCRTPIVLRQAFCAISMAAP